MLATAMLVAVPFGTQNALGYNTPGSGVAWNFDELVMFSGGAVTGGGGMYQVHENIHIMPGDLIYLMGGEDIMIDPGMGILIEVEGMFDGGSGMGTIFHSMGGPVDWEGFLVLSGSMFVLNGVTIESAMNGVYAENTIMTEVRNCWIGPGGNSGITFINVMGGPMVEANHIFGCNVGILTWDSSTQMTGNWIYNNNVGVRARGWAGPSINGNEIYDNSYVGIHLENADGLSILNNGIYGNFFAGIYSESSFSDIWQNTITGWDALPGSGMSGGSAIHITGTGPSAWYTTVSQNTIRGGHGDEFLGGVVNGGNGIYVENFEGLVATGPQLLIDQNTEIHGGNGGFNVLNGGGAGKGGCGILIESLTDDGDWMADNHAIKITNNLDISGGLGGDNMAMLDGFSGEGGQGIAVVEDDNFGSLKISGNALIQGGKGGDSQAMDTGIGSWQVGNGGNAIMVINCQPGSRVEVLDNPDIRGGPAGVGFMMPADNQGGSGIRFEGSGDAWVDNTHGTSEFGLVTLNGCSGTIDITGISVTDSNANNGNLVRASNSDNNGNNENWNFGGKNGLKGVVLNKSHGFNIKNYTAHTYNAPALDGFRSNFTLWNASLQAENDSAVSVKATQNNEVTINKSKAFNSLVGFDFEVGGNSRVTVKDSSSGFVIADAVRFKLVNVTDVAPDNDTDGVLDLFDNCLNESEEGVNISIDGDSVDGFDVDVDNNTIENNTKAGIKVKVDGEGNIGNTSVKLSGNLISGSVKGVVLENFKVEFTSSLKVQDNFVYKSERAIDMSSTSSSAGKKGGSGAAPMGIWAPSPRANGFATSNVIIANNKLENNTKDGIHVEDSHDFDISGNLVANNTNYGISLVDCTGGRIYHNNIIDNVWRQAYDNGDNQWDAGYPAGGNYWSDYAGIDFNHGPDQNIFGSDGMGDTAYININDEAYMGWANNSAFPNYAPEGMPDFDQKQTMWMTLHAGGNGVMDSAPIGDDVIVNPTPGPFGICLAPGPNNIMDTPPFGDDTLEYAYCGPVSAANALWWLDSKFADHTGIPGDGNDTFDLVEDLGAGDDHDSANPPLLVETLAPYFGTEIFGDTDPARMVTGLNQYLINTGQDANFTVLDRQWPFIEQVGEEQQNNSAVILFLGFYDDEGNRIYGHIVTVAGVEMGGLLLSLSDPIANMDNPIADPMAYNDPENVSHDFYPTLPGAPHPSLPGWVFWLPTYMSGYGIPMPPLTFAVCEHMVAIKHTYKPVDRYPLMAPYEYVEYDIPLLQGWNLISLPLRQFSWGPYDVLETINGSWDCVQAYDTVTDTWKTLNLHRPDVLNDAISMNHFGAYWVNVTQPGLTLTVRGDKFGSQVGTPLYAGWNLLGYSSLVPQTVGFCFVGTGYDRPVETFDGAAPYRLSPIGIADLVESGNGYWVHVPVDDIWMVNW